MNPMSPSDYDDLAEIRAALGMPGEKLAECCERIRQLRQVEG